MTSVRDAFNATARDYDAARRRLIPCFDEYYGAALALLPFAADESPRILDLGAGTGLFSGMVLAKLPRARLVLFDLAEDMLAKARERLAGHDVAYQAGAFEGPLPEGPFDAVVSALAIHHLDDAEKRRLFARVHGLLPPGGVFVNAEQILAPTPATQARDRAWWHTSIRAAGASEEEITQAGLRMAHDKMATLGDQMAWLAEAGFVEVDCVYKNGWFAVYGGRRG